jgi:ribonuclease HI
VVAGTSPRGTLLAQSVRISAIDKGRETGTCILARHPHLNAICHRKDSACHERRKCGEFIMLKEDVRNTIVEIFADGACSGNPGPGGYAAIVRYGQSTKEISGCEPLTTNNRMELMAAIEALKLIKRPSRIRVVTDSTYLVKGMTEWVQRWIKQGWMNSQKRPVANRALWEALIDLNRRHEIEWKWTRGHKGHVENERCDYLAKKAIQSTCGS